MAKRNMQRYDTADIDTNNIAQEVDDLITLAESHRKPFERVWYDNNFFDDGKHFRYVSRETGKIVDLSNKVSIYTPMRSIPKASRQIRGIANMLLVNDPHPVVYPEKVLRINYKDKNEAIKAWEEARDVALREGHWLEEEWKNQELVTDKIPLMIILAAKNGISWLQVWPDANEEKIRTQVYDAFDVYLYGTVTDPEHSPFIAKAIPTQIKDIKSNEIFDEGQLEKISADNKYASSEIKEAYLMSKHGLASNPDTAATLILKECYVKEFLSEENWKKASKDSKVNGCMEGKNLGDVIMRQVFTAGGEWLKDGYVNLDKYPLIDLRYEPGPIYQVPPISRFIPQNKSLDNIVSRLESFAHTMGIGVYQKRKGENFDIDNKKGAHILEYEATPLTQMTLPGVPNYFPYLIDLMQKLIEEQGVTTTALGKVPKGVKAHAAIESLKQSEFSNLHIPLAQLKKTISHISERFFNLAGNYFIKPQTVEKLEKGEPDYFDIIGEAGVKARKKDKIKLPNGVVMLRKEPKVRVEIESGVGFTEEGKRSTMFEIANFMRDLAREGYMNQEAVKVMIERLLETFKFGGARDFMQALEKGFDGQDIPRERLEEMKIAMLEVFRDLNRKGGMGGTAQQQQQPKGPSKSVSYKDLPPTGKAQMAAQAGVKVSPQEIQQDEIQKEVLKNATKNRGQ